MIKKICLYGPESVGKTTMGQQLAAHYQTNFVHEVARDMVFDNQFSLADIERIGQAQTEAVLDAIQTANRLLICDTDLVTTALYSQIYLSAVPPLLADLEKQVQYDRYFLLNIDVPWVSDGLRDLGHRRTEIYNLFRDALDQRGIQWVDVSGSWAQRWQIVTAEIDQLLG
jgi:HTH-type transcriptional regulator, transcriptional repressor of NAD biosynthesis genes